MVNWTCYKFSDEPPRPKSIKFLKLAKSLTPWGLVKAQICPEIDHNTGRINEYIDRNVVPTPLLHNKPVEIVGSDKVDA